MLIELPSITLVLTTLIMTIMPLASQAASKNTGYIVKLTGKTSASESGDSLFFYTNKGKKQVYLYGLDDSSLKVLSHAIKKKSCVKIIENANPNELAMGAVIKRTTCPKK